MAVADILTARDSAGSQIPGTTFSAFSFASTDRNDNSTYGRPSNTRVLFTEAGHYLIVATLKFEDTSNGRATYQARCIGVGAPVIFTSYATGYNRDTSEDTAWVRVYAIVRDASEDDEFEIQMRRDTDAPTGGSVAGASHVQVVRLSDESLFASHTNITAAQAMGGTSPTAISTWDTGFTDDSSVMEMQGDSTTMRLKDPTKRYLILYSVAGQTGGSRTQRMAYIHAFGGELEGTRGYFYQRNSANEYGGMAVMTALAYAAGDLDFDVRVYRGAGVSADQGGADVNGSWTMGSSGETGLCVVALPNHVDLISGHDHIGLENVATTTRLFHNAINTVAVNDADSFTSPSAEVINCEQDMDVLAWANIVTARNNITSGARLTLIGSIEVGGVIQTIGEHGNYDRGNQGSQDTFGNFVNPCGMYAVSDGDDLRATTLPLSGSEAQAGSVARTQPDWTGFYAINLSSLVPPVSGTEHTLAASVSAKSGGGAIASRVIDVAAEIQTRITPSAHAQVIHLLEAWIREGRNNLTGDLLIGGSVELSASLSAVTRAQAAAGRAIGLAAAIESLSQQEAVTGLVRGLVARLRSAGALAGDLTGSAAPQIELAVALSGARGAMQGALARVVELAGQLEAEARLAGTSSTQAVVTRELVASLSSRSRAQGVARMVHALAAAAEQAAASRMRTAAVMETAAAVASSSSAAAALQAGASRLAVPPRMRARYVRRPVRPRPRVRS